MKLFIATPISSVPKYLTLDKILHRECGTDGKDIFLASVEALIAERPVSFMFRAIPGIAPIGLARNRAVTEFLKTDCTDLLFWDSDIGASPADVKRICAHDADIVLGLYPLKQEGPPKLVVTLLDGESVNEFSGLQKVRGGGAGFMRIHRSVFERLEEFAESYFNELGEPESNFFRHGVADGRYWGEDLSLCNLAREHGIDVHSDWGIRLAHQGHDRIFRCEPETQTTTTQPTTPTT